MTHVWRWDKWPRTAWPWEGASQSRKGQRCKVVCIGKGPGPRNCLVEFEDGALVVVTNAAYRHGMRRIPQPDKETA